MLNGNGSFKNNTTPPTSEQLSSSSSTSLFIEEITTPTASPITLRDTDNNDNNNGIQNSLIVENRIDEDDDSMSSRSRTCARELADHVFNLAIVTPLIVLHWASSWDIIYLYLFPSSVMASYAITFAICNLVLLVSYYAQTWLQKLHDSGSSGSRSALFPSSQQRRHSACYYYNKQFLIRFVYTYVITWAYVAQWRTYWDVYNHFTEKVPFEYFLAISALTLVLYRYVLKCSFKSFALMVPFRLQRDLKFNEYFMQAKVILVNYKWLENITSFFYYEIVEMVISVFVWKGVWDMFDSGADLIFPNKKLRSIGFTLAVGYSIYAFLMLLERIMVRKTTTRQRRSLLVDDLMYLVAYFAMVATWRSFWSAFDYFALAEPSPHRLNWILGTHAFTFVVLFSLKLGSSVYGPAGTSNEPATASTAYRLFEIQYFGAHTTC